MAKQTMQSLVVAAAVVLASGLLNAQTPAGAAPGRGGAQDGAAANAPVTANKLAPNFYALQATGLSTVGALVGPDGVLMVDSGTAAFTERLVAAIIRIIPAATRTLRSWASRSSRAKSCAYGSRPPPVEEQHRPPRRSRCSPIRAASRCT